jgi:hypothetical protein
MTNSQLWADCREIKLSDLGSLPGISPAPTAWRTMETSRRRFRFRINGIGDPDRFHLRSVP